MKKMPDDLFTGNISRRKFIERATAAGLTLSVLGCATKIGKQTSAAKPSTPDWTQLQNKVQGQVIPPGGVEYETNRQKMLWNAVKPKRFPGAIVRVGSEADVREAIRFARRHKLKVAIRGGGHHWHNPALRQGGLLLDLSGLNRLQVDAQNRIAVVQPGVTGATLMASLAPHGLAFPVGHEGPVGLSGFLLNGGLGWNYRVWGPSCSSIEAIDLVDARGESIRADRNHYADLFWAARGAGPGFFGVVTRFHLNVHPLPRAIMTSSLRYRIEDIDKVAAWLPQLVGSLPLNVEFSCRGQVGRDNSRFLGIRAHAFANTVAEGRDALGAFETGPTGVSTLDKSLYERLSVEDVFGRATTGFREGPRCRGESIWSNASPEAVLLNCRAAILAAPSRPAQVSFVGLGFYWVPLDPNGPQQPDMAYSLSGSMYAQAYMLWNNAAEDMANRAWLRNAMTSLEPLKIGHWVGDADLTIAPSQAEQCFSPSAWERLTRLKRKYDPDDIFFSYLQHE